MRALCHLRDEFLHDNVQHRAGRKAQQVRQRRYNKPRRQDRQQGTHRFHRPGQRTRRKCLRLAESFCMQRHRYDRPLREVLDRNAQCERQRGPGRDAHVPGDPGRIDNADCHSFGQIVHRDSQHQHGCPLEFIPGTLRPFEFIACKMQVRHDRIEQQQEQDACPEPGRCRQKCQTSERSCFFHRGDQQTPHRSRHHDARCKPRQDPLRASFQLPAHDADAGRAKRRSDKWDEDSHPDLYIHKYSPCFYMSFSHCISAVLCG